MKEKWWILFVQKKKALPKHEVKIIKAAHRLIEVSRGKGEKRIVVVEEAVEKWAKAKRCPLFHSF